MDELEKAAELAAQQEVKEEEVRAKIIDDLGFDVVDDAERIDKLVAKEIEGRKALSAAIGQKIKYRTEAETLKTNPPKPKEAETPAKPEEVSKVVAAELDRRDLETLGLPDELKTEVQRIAQIQNVSVMQAARDPYIVSKKAEWDKSKAAEDAAISRTHRPAGGKRSYDPNKPPEVDMSTKEGREEWDAWKKASVAAGN